ncbi:MAG: hypothetical protein AAF353_00550 [Pseudomonadota bacterium]
MTEKPEVIRLADIAAGELICLLGRFGIELVECEKHQPIPASFWGEDEAGLRGNQVFARADTPIHSILHESGHYICADEKRRRKLDRDAASDDAEETAVCYLQILLAEQLQCLGKQQAFADMDAWGYSFRLGSTRAWFENDTADAHAWLSAKNIIDSAGLTFNLAQ